jgi:fructose-1,6-bisphosphatase
MGTNEGAAQYVRYTTTTYLTLAVSDYVEMYVYTTSNNSLVFQGGTGVGNAQCWFEGHKLVGV